MGTPAAKRFHVYVAHPPSQADYQVLQMAQAAPRTLQAQLQVWQVSPEQRGAVPPQVLALGMPVLLDTSAGQFSPGGAGAVHVLGSMIDQAQRMAGGSGGGAGVDHARARAQALLAARSVAPPDSLLARAAVSGGTGLPRGAATLPQAAYVVGGVGMSDSIGRGGGGEGRGGGMAPDPRMMPGSSLPHPSQMAAPYVAGAMGRPQQQPPGSSGGGFTAVGPAGKVEIRDSVLGPLSTNGGGQGLAGNQMQFGRQGIGFGATISADPRAGVNEFTTQQSAFVLDAAFGGERTGVNVENTIPARFGGQKPMGAYIQADTFEHGKVDSASLEALARSREANERAIQERQRGRAGAIQFETDPYMSSRVGGSDVQNLMSARASAPIAAPMAGLSALPTEPINDNVRSKNNSAYGGGMLLRPPIGASGMVGAGGGGGGVMPGMGSLGGMPAGMSGGAAMSGAMGMVASRPVSAF